MPAGMRLQMVWGMRADIKDSTLWWMSYFFRNCYTAQTRYQFLLETGPVHEWYEGNYPGAVLLGIGNRRDETTLKKFRSRHTRAQRQVLKSFILLVRIAMLRKPPISWLALVAIRTSCSQVLLQFFNV
ncbi:hypothetical protein TNCV_4776901 [Trichonephila clavipes]|nr:hypothetical protein TNCV_4776901 [Trichonephila clavipes]